MIALVLIPVLGGIVCLLLKERKGVGPVVALATTFAGGSALPFVLFNESATALGKWGALGINLMIDDLSIPFLLSTFFVTLAVVLNSYRKGYENFFYSLILILYGTLNSIFLSRDLFNIFVTVELASIISFILISYEKKPRQAWASLKYLLLSSLGLNFYLLGIGIVYMETGSFAMENLHQASTVSTVLIFGGLAIKSGLFLFSMWLPDAHSNAPIHVSPILSALIVKIDVYLSVRFIGYEPFAWLKDFYIVLGLLSALVGAYMALNSMNAKRLLAYSTMSQVGFMMVNCDKTSSWHGFSHAIFKTLLFLVVGNISYRLGTKKYTEWNGKISRMEHAFLLIGSLAMIGFPLTSGCVTKEAIIHGACCPWLKGALYVASTATAVSFARLLFLMPSSEKIRMQTSHLISYILLTGVILSHGILGFELYELEALIPATVGVLIYMVSRRYLRPISNRIEKLDFSLIVYLIAVMVSMGAAFLRT
ncbi:proton-conducting transporter membrane subunit [Mesotoga sp. B105.6.4]|uniref:proton-conducting transporter transmembrane domain-containing protein n=1 Tax=Mesotoga sp. B105.6.4 TaxID=1582224 RepID=UPI000CCC3304|nr:proton-conducting transporter membrane subunit [Mesotoga sp. B105.6.4]PNS36571.1 NADH-ubiquinone oxidoreductase [Mesotoga sp. B105.6.4]